MDPIDGGLGGAGRRHHHFLQWLGVVACKARGRARVLLHPRHGQDRQFDVLGKRIYDLDPGGLVVSRIAGNYGEIVDQRGGSYLLV